MRQKKRFIWTAGILAVLASVFMAAPPIMARMGKASLLKNASSRMPQFSDEAEPPPAEEAWEEDWIRYRGKVYDYNENILDRKSVV